ncbi:MAG: hypothetical protein KGI79_03325, partial [Patescibacteria group bacterium]|nr:hypothetical protein [Patescibacteria group bacterium]
PSLPVRFLASEGGQTSQGIISVNPVSGFNQPVTIDVQSTDCPSVSGYSFDGGDFVKNPQVVITADGSDNYRAPSGTIGLGVEVQFSAAISHTCTVTFEGNGGGDSATFDVTVDPNAFNPVFREF